MPNESISMSKLKQLVGLQASNLRVRALARALGLSVGAVSGISSSRDHAVYEPLPRRAKSSRTRKPVAAAPR